MYIPIDSSRAQDYTHSIFNWVDTCCPKDKSSPYAPYKELEQYTPEFKMQGRIFTQISIPTVIWHRSIQSSKIESSVNINVHPLRKGSLLSDLVGKALNNAAIPRFTGHPT
eukprot:1149454-Pelagomonas_calceolata.AAC.2